MKCFNCPKISYPQINCPLCNQKYCSNSCLNFHITTNHSTNNNHNIINVYEKPKIKRKSNNNLQKTLIISSPYITFGYLTEKIIYDQKYDLKNFIPVYDNKEPVIIGTGAYGKVFLYKNKIDKKLYAIKHMDKKCLNKSLKTLKGIYDEINIQSRIYHQNIVRLLYVKESSQGFDLVMRFANKGSLFHYIRKKKKLTEKESFKYFSQIINAVYFLHKNDLIHRDIKPENILLFDNNLCKLCDFGWCVKLDGKQRRTFCGTPEYMSPEIINKMEYSKEIDVWSLGILLYEMIHGYSPFRPENSLNAFEVLNKIKIHNLKFNINITKECKELICHLLDENVENRYKIEDVFNSSFVKKYENRNSYLPIQGINDQKIISDSPKQLIRKKENIDYYNLNLEIPQNIKVKNNNNNNIIFPSFLKNSQMKNKTSNNSPRQKYSDKYNNIIYNNNKNNYSQINNNIINNNNDILNQSIENKYNINLEIPPENNNFLNSTSSIIFKNVKVKKPNLTENNYGSSSDIFKFNNLNSENIKNSNKLKKNSKISNIKKLVNTNSSTNIGPINFLSINNNINLNNNINTNSSSKSILINKNLYLNKRLNNYNNYLDDDDNIKIKKYSTEKTGIEIKLNYSNRPKIIEKKLSSTENSINIKNIINYNTFYFTNKRNNSYQYKKIQTSYNSSLKNSISDRVNTNSKDNNNNIRSQIKLKKKNIKIDNNSKENIKNINIIKFYKHPSLIKNNYFNTTRLKNDNKKEINRNMIYCNKNITSIDKIQYNEKFNNTCRLNSNIKLYKKNKNLYLNSYNNYNNSHLNIFNSKIISTKSENSSLSISSKSKTKNNSLNKHNIIYVEKNNDNNNLKNINLKKLNRTQSFQKKFINHINKKFENNIKKIKTIQFNYNNGGKNSEILNKKKYINIQKFNSELFNKRKNNKKNNIVLGDYIRSKKYIKMNEILKYKNINNNFKNDTLQKIDQLKNMNNNKKPEKKTNEKIMKLIEQHNNKINKKGEELIKNKFKEKNLDKMIFSERNINNNKSKVRNNYIFTFSEKFLDLKQQRKKDDKTPKKDKDKKKINPTELLNELSSENKFFKIN